MYFNEKIGRLGLETGCFAGNPFAVMDLQILQIAPWDTLYIFSIHIAKLAFTIYWDLGRDAQPQLDRKEGDGTVEPTLGAMKEYLRKKDADG